MPSDDSDILFPSAQDSDGFEFDSDDAQFVCEDDGELKPLLGDDYYMRAALRCAQQAADAGEVPVGAVAVKDGLIIARSWNQVELLKDATADHRRLAFGRHRHLRDQGTVRDVRRGHGEFTHPPRGLRHARSALRMCRDRSGHHRIPRHAPQRRSDRRTHGGGMQGDVPDIFPHGPRERPKKEVLIYASRLKKRRSGGIFFLAIIF